LTKTFAIAFVWLSVTSLSGGLMAQQAVTFTGTVTSGKEMPIGGVSVSLIAADSVKILSFSTTDEKGKYLLSISQDQLRQAIGIKTSSIGYKLQIKSLIPGQAIYDFNLIEQSIILKDVVVVGGVPRVKISGDTTTYRVKDYAGVQDRSIGDVLKRIPGITVENNGQIKFNGKKVSKLYLDGDDLLDDKYNIGTRTIPQKLVDDIQVLENHQTIKALEGKIFSDEVDINLNFKPEAALKIVGEVQAGAGVPKLYDEDVNALSLKKKYKAIDEVKLNNIGNVLENENISFNDAINAQNRGYTPDLSQLSTGTASTPSVDQSRYAFNNSGLFNSANLWKLPSGLQIKSLIYYQYDRLLQKYQGQTNTYLPDGMINYTESQDNENFDKNAYGNVIIQANRADYYLNNALIFKYKNEEDNSYLISNQQPLRQSHFNIVDDIANELKIIKSPKGKILTEYYSYLNYRTSPEQLLIDSATYPALFNTASSLYLVKQNVNIPTFYTNNYIGIHLASPNITQSYKLGISAKLQNFKSDLTAYDQSNNLIVPDSAFNKVPWNRVQTYAEPDYDWRKGYFRVVAKFPVLLQQITFDNSGTNQTRNTVLFNPFVSVRYDQPQGVSGDVFYSRTNDAGNLLQTYNGQVLNSYRSISQNDQIFSIAQVNTFGAVITYKNPVKIFFVNLSANYIRSYFNNIVFNSVSKDLSYTGNELYDNLNRTFNARLTLSKYIYSLNTTVSLSCFWVSMQTNQVVNNAIFPFINTGSGLDARLVGVIGKKIRYIYNLNWLANSDSPENNIPAINPINGLSATNSLELEYNITNELNLKATDTDVLNSSSGGLNTNYNFVDFLAKYRLVKYKTDFQLEAINLANIKNYQNIALSSNIQSYYQYPLRGRLIVMKAIFTF
jgi:hypothetical protein